jgi:hypothetical protein
MRLFKLIEIDTETERKRIAKVKYNKRQKKALLKLLDLFEEAKFQECLNHVHKAFPYNERGDYSEKDHIGMDIGEVLNDMGHNNYYTKKMLLDEAREILKKENK